MEIPSQPIKQLAATMLIGALLVTISILYLDRPVEQFVAAHRQYQHFFEVLASPSLLALPFLCIYLSFFAFCRLTGRPDARYTSLCLTLCIAIAVATAAKDELKWLIGRPWPLTWVKFGVYHLSPFSDNEYFGSFPSGHTTYIAAPMFVLWFRQPRYRALWLAITLLVMIGLVGGGYHWVADVIAGFFLGALTAAGSVAVFARPQRRRGNPSSYRSKNGLNES